MLYTLDGQPTFYSKVFKDSKDPLFLEALGNPLKEDSLILEFYFGVPRYVAAQMLERMTLMYRESLKGQEHMEDVMDHGYFLEKTTLMNDYFMKKNQFANMEDSYFHLIEPRPMQFTKFVEGPLHVVNDIEDKHEIARKVESDKNIQYFFSPGALLPVLSDQYNTFVEHRRKQRLYLTNLLEIDIINFNSQQKSMSLALFEYYFDFCVESEANDYTEALEIEDPSSTKRTDFYVLEQYESNEQPSNSDISNTQLDILAVLQKDLFMDTRIFLILSIGVYAYRLTKPFDEFNPITLPLDTKRALESLAIVFKHKYINENYLSREELINKPSSFFDDREGDLVGPVYHEDMLMLDPDERPPYQYVPAVPAGVSYTYTDLAFPKYDDRYDAESNLGYKYSSDFKSDIGKVNIAIANTKTTLGDRREASFRFDLHYVATLDMSNLSQYEKNMRKLESALNLKDDRRFPQFQFLQQISKPILLFEYKILLRDYMLRYDNIVLFNTKDVTDYDIFFHFMFLNDMFEHPLDYGQKYPPENYESFTNFEVLTEKEYRYEDFIDYATGIIFIDHGLKERWLGGLKGRESSKKEVVKPQKQSFRAIL